MSIIAAKAGDYTNLRIVTFGSDGAVPYTDADGVLAYRSNRFANTYGKVNNSGFQSAGYWDGKHNTIIMRVRLLPGAVGMLFGTANYNISVIGTSLTFKVGSSTKTISCTEGWHIIGFLDMADGIGLYYDGLVRENGEPVMFSTTFTMTKIFIGKGSSTGPHVQIAKVVTCEFRTDTDNKPMMMHYYPVTTSTPSAVSCSWYETRYLQDLVTSSGTTTASGVAADYGIGIDDLREIFGSGYDNLLAIIADDGGANTDLGWKSDETSPYVVTRTKDGETITRNFAFDLSGAWVLDAYEPSRPTGGYLKQGRKPKWNIFHDAIKNGFTVDHVAGTTLYKLRYNLFRTLESADKPDIVWFENYDTSKDNVHYPAVELGSTLGGGLQFTNGLPYPCTNLFVGYPTRTTIDYNLYFADVAQSGKVRGRLGNLAPWNFTSQELGTTDDSEWRVAGWAVRVVLFGDSPFISAVRTLTSDEIAAQDGKMFLSKDTPDTIKAKFQSGMEDADGSITYNNARALFHRLMLQNPQKTGDEWVATLPNQNALFEIVRPSGIGKSFDTLSEQDIIDISDLMPNSFTCDIHGKMKYGQYNIIELQSEDNVGVFCHYVDRFEGIWQRELAATRLYFGLKRISSQRTDRLVAKLEMIWCINPDSSTDAPLYPDDYQCELILSRTRDEMLKPKDSSARPIRFRPNETDTLSTWKYAVYHDDEYGEPKSESATNYTVQHFEIGSKEFFGDWRSSLPTYTDGEYYQPDNILAKITVFDADSAPIASMFRANSWDIHNQTPMFWTGSKAILAYQPSQDAAPTIGKCALWNFKSYNHQSGVYTPTDLIPSLNGVMLKITRIHYHIDTTNNEVLRQVTQYDTVNLDGYSTYYNINLGGSRKHILRFSTFEAEGELWLRPGTDGYYEEPAFTQMYLDPEGSEGTNYAKGDTFILEFTN